MQCKAVNSRKVNRQYVTPYFFVHWRRRIEVEKRGSHLRHNSLVAHLSVRLYVERRRTEFHGALQFWSYKMCRLIAALRRIRIKISEFSQWLEPFLRAEVTLNQHVGNVSHVTSKPLIPPTKKNYWPRHPCTIHKGRYLCFDRKHSLP
jgi:hypothetical protein